MPAMPAEEPLEQGRRLARAEARLRLAPSIDDFNNEWDATRESLDCYWRDLLAVLASWLLATRGAIEDARALAETLPPFLREGTAYQVSKAAPTVSPNREGQLTLTDEPLSPDVSPFASSDAYSDGDPTALWAAIEDVLIDLEREEGLVVSAAEHRAVRKMLLDGGAALAAHSYSTGKSSDRYLGPRGVLVEDRTPFEHAGVYSVVRELMGQIPGDEAQLLRDVSDIVESKYLIPDLLIYREMRRDQLRERVRALGRPGEESLDLDFLEAVRGGFERFINEWDRSPVLRIPSEADVLDDETLAGIVSGVVLKSQLS